MNYDAGIMAEGHDPIAFERDEADLTATGRKLRMGIIVTLAIFAALAAIWFVAGGKGEAGGAGDTAAQAFSVSVIAPGQTTIAGEINATGTLAARREMPVGVVGEGGRVVSVPVEQGQWVEQGQVLAIIDRSVQSQQAQSAAASIQVAQADADIAQANLTRASQLVKRGFISTAEIDRLTATRDAATARVRVAQAQYRELLARNARLNIVAPAAGLLLERHVEPGQTVSGGTTALFSIARGGEMEMQAQLGEVDLAQVSVGQTATVTPVGTDRAFVGQIWQVEPTIDAGSRQGIARIALPYAPELRPGGFASAAIRSGSVAAPLLPESAILSDDAGSFVYIIDKDDKVVRRKVKTGNVTADGIIIAEGLNGRERVVLRAGGFLNPGEKVRPVLEKATAKAVVK